MDTLAVLERQRQFDFQKNGIETMNFETLQRTYKENDIYNKPVQGIYHYQVIQRMMDICEKYNLDYEVEEIFAAQNRNKTQPGVSILPQVEQTHGEKAVEAHILRRIFATIRIKDWETDELTTTLVVAYHQDGIQAAIGPLRGEHERGHRADTADEAPNRLPGRNIYVYRTADGHARGPRQFGQEPVILRGNLSAEPGTDIPVHGRGAETGRGKGADYRLGSV